MSNIRPRRVGKCKQFPVPHEGLLKSLWLAWDTGGACTLPLCMPLAQPLVRHLESVLTRERGRALTIQQALRVHGGSVNDAFRLDTEDGPFFLKINLADQFPSLFESEAHGLALLRQAGELRVPELIAHGEFEDTTFLLLEFVAPAEEDPGFQARFGQALARLHRHAQATFGLDRDNHIGLLRQVNTPHREWTGFLIHCRFGPLVK